MYNLEYWVGKLKIETVLYNLPYPILASKKKLLKQSNSYKLGKFKYVKI